MLGLQFSDIWIYHLGFLLLSLFIVYYQHDTEASMLSWWQRSSSRCSKYQCKLFKLIWLILPGINNEALIVTLHLENVLSRAYLMVLEASEKFKYFFFLSRETACSVQFTLYMEVVGILFVSLNTLSPNCPNGLLIERVHYCYSRFPFFMESMSFLF